MVLVLVPEPLVVLLILVVELPVELPEDVEVLEPFSDVFLEPDVLVDELVSADVIVLLLDEFELDVREPPRDC